MFYYLYFFEYKKIVILLYKINSHTTSRITHNPQHHITIKPHYITNGAKFAFNEAFMYVL